MSVTIIPSAVKISMPSVPNDADEVVLSLAKLNPDLNNDGNVDAKEKAIHNALLKADTDGDGQITRGEFYNAILDASVAVDMARRMAGQIPIDSLNPDCDGDGKVEPWEREVFERIKKADVDQSNTIDVKEFYGVIKGAAASDKQKNRFKLLFTATALLALTLLLANMGLTFAVVYFAKDSYVSSSTLRDANDNVLKTAPAVVKLPLFSAPVMSLSELNEVNAITLSLRGSHVRSIYNVAAVDWHSSTRVAFFLSAKGHILKVWDGDSFLEDATGHRVGTVCSADTTCSALYVESAKQRATYLQYARGNLTASGVAVPSGWDGRRRLVDEHGRALYGGGTEC